MITLDNVFRSPYVDLFNQFVVKLQKNEYNEKKNCNKESSILTLIYRFIFTKFCAFDGKVMIDSKKNCLLNVKNIVK